jgi:hypothetical protein
MALRIYMIRGNPASGPGIGVTFYRYAWSTGGTPSPFLGDTDKSVETANNYAIVNNGVGSPGPINDTDACLTHVYLLPTDLYLSGTIDIGIPALADFRYQYNIVLHIWVTQGTSGLTRGTLLNGYIEPGGTNDLPPSTGPVTFVQLAAPQTIAPLQALAGDYVVFELGIIARGPAPNNGGVNYYIGVRTSAGAIMPDGVAGDVVDGVLGSHAPWYEFALIPAPPPQPTNCPPCTPAPGSTPNPIGTLPPWVQTCTSGGDVDSVADLTDGENWAA